MGGAMLSAWLDALPDAHFYVVDRHATLDDFGAPSHLTLVKKADERLRACGIIIVAVKPQVMKVCADEIIPLLNPDSIIISVAAGLSFDTLTTQFGASRGLAKIMPNTPCSIRKGMSIAMKNGYVNDTTMPLIRTLCDALGDTLWIEDETLFDPMTTISGCGPAYLFYMIEMLAAAGVNAGVDKNDAERLARQTIIGAASLAELSSTSAKTLRKNVTSKGGVTQAALDVIMDGRVQEVYNDALIKAVERAKNLNA